MQSASELSIQEYIDFSGLSISGIASYYDIFMNLMLHFA